MPYTLPHHVEFRFLNHQRTSPDRFSGLDAALRYGTTCRGGNIPTRHPESKMGHPVTLPEMPQSRQYHPGKESLPRLYCFHNIFCTILSAYVSILFSHESSACRIIYRRTHRIRKILNSRRTGGFAKRGNRKCGCLPGVPEIPVLTAAPSAEEQARVPHHMISIIPVQTPWDATEHYHRTMQNIRQIHARGKTAIITGGSGLYFKFLSHGLSEAPPGNPEIRASSFQPVPRRNCTPASSDPQARPPPALPTGAMWNATWKLSLPAANRFPSGGGTGKKNLSAPVGPSPGMSRNWTTE